MSLPLNFDNSFTQELPADPSLINSPRQVIGAAYSYVTPKKTVKPELLISSKELAKELGLSEEDLAKEEFLQLFSGNKVFAESKPYAMCYGGHQFGHWAGQLGDGRAINLGEVVFDHKRWALQLKGAGPTPYSRTADGLAVLRSSIREFLCSEAMFYLGVPTTRALSLSLTGDQVLRDVMYDGNPAYEKGAVVCRVSPSFIRFGNFEIFAARKDTENIKRLADYCIKYFYPEIVDSERKYTDFFGAVAEKTLDMIIHWQRVGFVHGVMNTDNLSILGLTIDYGPYGWQDNFDPDWTPNTTDNQNKRYRFGNQGQIAFWNLVKLANAIYPLVGEAKEFENILEKWKVDFQRKYTEMMAEKIGLFERSESDSILVNDLEDNLKLSETDMTIFFRLLSNFKVDQEPIIFLEAIKESFYNWESMSEFLKNQWGQWFSDYRMRLLQENSVDTERKIKMDAINPKYVLRNYMAQEVIEKAEEGGFTLLHEVFEMLKKPYEEQINYQKWFAKRPDWAKNKVGCSALSCSS